MSKLLKKSLSLPRFKSLSLLKYKSLNLLRYKSLSLLRYKSLNLLRYKSLSLRRFKRLCHIVQLTRPLSVRYSHLDQADLVCQNRWHSGLFARCVLQLKGCHMCLALPLLQKCMRDQMLWSQLLKILSRKAVVKIIHSLHLSTKPACQGLWQLAGRRNAINMQHSCESLFGAVPGGLPMTGEVSVVGLVPVGGLMGP